MKRSSYNPAGLVSDKPIGLRLMPDELLEAERISAEAGISKSKLARAAYLKGLPLVCTELSLASPSGALDGEADPASPPSFSQE